MDLSHPAYDLFGRNATRILQRLALVKDGLTGRRISELSDVPLGSTQRALAHLERTGLVVAQPAGRAIIYSLSRGHVLWPVVAAALNAPLQLERLIAEIVHRHAGNSATVAVYGSFARGEAGPDSDLDVLIVWEPGISTDDQAALLDELNDQLENATGNRVEIVDLSLSDLHRLVAANDPLIESWKREAKTLSVGPDIKSLAKNAAA
ncbi:nucleotidyltransferase domain-containing protein [Arthrobacter livingstonensis]|nr:nucleotidyltransferase domain-containing protein [Arthrobacter livingstonensis]